MPLVAGLGPFEIAPQQVSLLGHAFTPFVNHLLDRERGRAGIAGHRLRVDSQETADGGVDSQVVGSVATTWIPSGDSAWQFKRGDLPPGKAKAELRGAGWARTLLQNGSAYRLVLGAELTAQKIDRRRIALVEEAQALGLPTDDLEVLDANALARWASEFPIFAISPLFGGTVGFQDFETWSQSRAHQALWVAGVARQAVIDQIRSDMVGQRVDDIRIEGPSGIGKTRLAMEAMRGNEWTSLVAYVPDATAAGPSSLQHLLNGGRSVIMVVDECGRRQHEKLCEMMPVGVPLKLVTIGEADDHQLQAPLFVVEALEDDAVQEFLRVNHPTLWGEAQRFVVEHCAGNVEYAIFLANGIESAGAAEAAGIIAANDLTRFLALQLPAGDQYVLSSLLALFERVGWDRELRGELEAIAEYAGASVDDFEEAANDLEERGLLVRQGRFRAVVPHPVAVYLAASAWRANPQRIVEELLPSIDRNMALRLFRRAADLGTYEPAQQELLRLIAPEGPFGSLESIESHDLASFLTQLAIVAPVETARHISHLVAEASSEQLRAQTRSRRDLVWALEKLAWHQRLLEIGAGALLKLALAENESYSNNATGTWLDLFGAVLPATAATPEQRLTYLRRVSVDDDPVVRELAVRAAERGLSPHEAVSVSAELQGGALVAPRGGVRTPSERGDYQREVLGVLADLARDEEDEVRRRAEDVLIGALHPLIDDLFVGATLTRALASLGADAQRRLRRSIEGVRDLLEHHSNRSLEEAIERLAALLPPLDPLDELWLLLQSVPWRLDREDKQARLRECFDAVVEAGTLNDLLPQLHTAELNGAWFLGKLLEELGAGQDEIEPALIAAANVNPGALRGYLDARVDRGDDRAFDRFLRRHEVELGPGASLSLIVRAPLTREEQDRVFRLVGELPAAEAARRVLGWPPRDADPAIASELLTILLGRIETQDDYNAAIEWAGVLLIGQEIPPALYAQLLPLIQSATQFPQLGGDRWSWSRLASHLVSVDAPAIATSVLDMIDNGLIVLDSDPEAQVLIAAAGRDPIDVWRDVAGRIEGEGWRVAMSIRGWLLPSIPVAVLMEWVGTRSVVRDCWRGSRARRREAVGCRLVLARAVRGR